MTGSGIQLLDDLWEEFARVEAEHARSHPRARVRRWTGMRGRAVAVAFTVLILLGGGAYAVPPTRAAIEDVGSMFGSWVEGSSSDAPGRAVEADDAPDWIRANGGRVIKQSSGVTLYVTRTQTDRGIYLQFSAGEGTTVGYGTDGWREAFESRAVIGVGPSPFDSGRMTDEQGRVPVVGLTARSVKRIELRYAAGPPLVTTDTDGGFVLLADASRPLRELIAYDAAGQELQRIDVGHIRLPLDRP